MTGPGVSNIGVSMQKIVPHLWFDNQVKEATVLYTSVFKNSKILSTTTIKDTPSGDSDIVSFELSGIEFMAISAGPYFKLNPSISFSVAFNSENEIETAWNTLIKGGKALMDYATYPWANKYGWLQDKYGVSWQMSWSEGNSPTQKITPSLLFTQDKAGKAEEAIKFYTSIFPHSETKVLVPYTKEDGDTEGFIKHSQFSLAGMDFIAMDSSAAHDFVFNEAVSLIVNCKDQEEIDFYWEKLSAVPEAEQCGWLKDKFGVSWQIVPVAMSEMMEKGTPEQVARLTEAFLKMKKFDLAALQKAFEG